MDTSNFKVRHSLNATLKSKVFSTNKDGYATINQSLESIEPNFEE